MSPCLDNFFISEEKRFSCGPNYPPYGETQTDSEEVEGLNLSAGHKGQRSGIKGLQEMMLCVCGHI